MSGNESKFLLVNKSLPEDHFILDIVDTGEYFKEWSLTTVAERDRLLMVFLCPLCESDPVDGRICPECERYICLHCLKDAYERDGNSCPHCR